MEHPREYPTLHSFPWQGITVCTPDGAYWQPSQLNDGAFQVVVVGPMLPPVFYRMALDLKVGYEVEWVSQSFMDPPNEKSLAPVSCDRGIVSFVFRRKGMVAAAA